MSNQRLTAYDYSASAFNIYLGLDRRFEPERYGIGNWNIWYYPTGNLNQEYQNQLQGDLSHPWIFLFLPYDEILRTGNGSSRASCAGNRYCLPV